MRKLLLLPALALVLGPACGDVAAGDFGSQSSALTDGTPETIGVLAFLNSSDATFEVLDIDVGLDRRAARGLVDHREHHGAFRSIAEVDAVWWVGPAALARLGAYATDHGWVPAGDDLLGTWDDVAFTVNEAEATVAFVNGATEAELDYDAGLDRRAVKSLLEARPVATILEISRLYYVGPAAMLTLREYPKSLLGTVPDGSECTAHAQCASGLCAGLTIAMGFCQPAWMQGTYVSNDPALYVPDQDPVTSEIEITGQASVPMDVLVTLDIDHPRPQDLFVELFQPGGGYDVLWDHEANPPAVVNSLGVERDNMINGVWRVTVTDTVTGETGWLQGWSMWVTSRYD